MAQPLDAEDSLSRAWLNLYPVRNQEHMSYSNTYNSPFDWIAPDYDRIFTGSCTGKAQRDAVWQETDRLFEAGQRVMEMNCGTGVDAVHFAQRGILVSAFDQSGRMIEVARHRLIEAGCEQQVNLQQMTIEEMGQWSSLLPFDAAFSNFGGLNCVADLGPFSTGLARLVKPGGAVVFCLMNRYCLWEWAHFLGRFQLQQAFRRFSRGGVSTRFGNQATLRVYYPSVRELIRSMRPHFCYVSHKAVGLAVPPTYLERWVAEHSTFLHTAELLDRTLSHCPVLNSLGDHCLVHFVRR